MGKGDLQRNRVLAAGMDYQSWKDSFKAARAKQKNTTGVFNPRTGEREYGGGHRGAKKDMYGRRYSG